MNKVIQSNIEVVNVKFDDNGLIFDYTANSNYIFHYWGNFSLPLNNFLGFKTI
jgi:hypothetical protein